MAKSHVLQSANDVKARNDNKASKANQSSAPSLAALLTRAINRRAVANIHIGTKIEEMTIAEALPGFSIILVALFEAV